MCFKQRFKDIAPKKRWSEYTFNRGNRIVYLPQHESHCCKTMNRVSPFWYCYALLSLSGATDFKLIPSIWRKLDRRRGWIKLLVLTCGESRRITDSYTSWLKSLVKEGILQAEPPFSWRKMRGSCFLTLFQFMTALFWEKVQFAATVSSQSAGTWPLSLPLWSCQQPPVTELHIEHPRSSHNPRVRRLLQRLKSKKAKRHFLQWAGTDKVSRWDGPGATAGRWLHRLRLIPTCSLLPEPGRNILFCQG